MSRALLPTMKAWTFPILLLCLLACLVATSLPAADKSLKRLPGYVDGTAFKALAGEDSKVVMVSVDGALLKVLSGGFKSVEPDLAGLLLDLEAIQAVVIEGVEDINQVKRMFADHHIALESKGWSQIAEVRSKKENVSVFILSGEEMIDGLVVMVREGNKVVFANIAGKIDLARIAQLGAKMDIPGLEKVPTGGRVAGAEAEEEDDLQ